MLKITNGQAAAFNTQVIANLFSDQSRQFPIEDAFKLSDAIQQIQNRLPAYKTQLRKIIEENGGCVGPSGLVDYPDPKKYEIAQQQIQRLNAISFEVQCESVCINADWPKLSLAEATILRPLLNGSA